MAGNPDAFNMGGSEGRGDSGTAGGGGVPPTPPVDQGPSDLDRYGVETQVITHERGVQRKIRKYHPETGEVIPPRPIRYTPKVESDPDGNRYLSSDEIDKANKRSNEIDDWDDKYKVVSRLPQPKSSAAIKVKPVGAQAGAQPIPTAKPSEVMTALGNQLLGLRTFHASTAATINASGDEAASIYHHALGQALDLAHEAHKQAQGRMRQGAAEYASEHLRNVSDILQAAHGFASSEPISRLVGAPPISADEVSAWNGHAHNAIVPRRQSFSYSSYLLGSKRTADQIRNSLMAQGRHDEAAQVTNAFDPKDMPVDQLISLGRSLGMKKDSLDWRNGSDINRGILKAGVAGQGANQGVRVPPLERKEAEQAGESIDVVDPLTGEKKPYGSDEQFDPQAATTAGSNLGGRGEGLRVGTYQPHSGPGEEPKEGEARYEAETTVTPADTELNLGAFPAEGRVGVPYPSAGPMADKIETNLVATGLPEAHPQAGTSQARADEAAAAAAPVTRSDLESGQTISGDADLTPEVKREIQRQKDKAKAKSDKEARWAETFTPEQMADIRARGEAESEAEESDNTETTTADAQANVDKILKSLKERKPRRRKK